MQSLIASISPQADGRRWVQEVHTDAYGVQYSVTWLAQASDDAQAVMTARAVQMDADLIAGEVAANIASVLANGSLATVAVKYSTLAQNRTALRAAYLAATKQDAIMIGDFLSAQTTATLQALFGMTSAQVTTLRTNKLSPAASAASTIRASSGA